MKFVLGIAILSFVDIQKGIAEATVYDRDDENKVFPVQEFDLSEVVDRMPLRTGNLADENS